MHLYHCRAKQSSGSCSLKLQRMNVRFAGFGIADRIHLNLIQNAKHLTDFTLNISACITNLDDCESRRIYCRKHSKTAAQHATTTEHKQTYALLLEPKFVTTSASFGAAPHGATISGPKNKTTYRNAQVEPFALILINIPWGNAWGHQNELRLCLKTPPNSQESRFWLSASNSTGSIYHWRVSSRTAFQLLGLASL